MKDKIEETKEKYRNLKLMKHFKAGNNQQAWFGLGYYEFNIQRAILVFVFILE